MYFKIDTDISLILTNFIRSAFFVTAITWNKTGNRIYTGTSKGYFNMIDVETNKVRRFIINMKLTCTKETYYM